MTAALAVVVATLVLGGLLGSLHPPQRRGPRVYKIPFPTRSVLAHPRREPLYDTRVFEPPYAPDGPAWVAYTKAQRRLAREGRLHETGRKPYANPWLSVQPWVLAAQIAVLTFGTFALFSKYSKCSKDVRET